MEHAVPRTGMIKGLNSGRREEVYAFVATTMAGDVMSPRPVDTTHFDGSVSDFASEVAGVYVWRFMPCFTHIRITTSSQPLPQSDKGYESTHAM